MAYRVAVDFDTAAPPPPTEDQALAAVTTQLAKEENIENYAAERDDQKAYKAGDPKVFDAKRAADRRERWAAPNKTAVATTQSRIHPPLNIPGPQ